MLKATVPIEVMAGSRIRMPGGRWNTFVADGTFTVEVTQQDFKPVTDPRLAQAAGLLREMMEGTPAWQSPNTLFIEPDPEGEDDAEA